MNEHSDTAESLHDKIFEKARPYLSTRHNETHVTLSSMYARRLLKFYPDADEEIVLLAIILHDVGWKMVPEEKQLAAFGPKCKDEETRRLHEVEGARIAEGILRSFSYDEDKMRRILTIIDGHDTREKTVSLEDILVKDADKLWRYNPIGVDIDYRRYQIDREPYMAYLEGMIEKWFLTAEAKDMARKALAETRKKDG
ncbi:MAG TPA: phosphohydrolase [Deltaproteobacteria bacterium]|nr:phosphohydrolase [Deltaproteobacteria bacterium]